MYDENTPSHNAKKYVELVGLTEDYLDRSPFDLSGGQKRRIAVAGILAMNGDVLILDEPTAGLDPEGEQEFIALFKRLNIEEQKTIILVTHNMDHVLEIADYIVVMDKGKVVKYDTAVNVFADEQLMKQLEIEPPKIYKILYQLRDEGINLFYYNIKNLSQLTNVLIKMYETKGEVT